MFTFFKKRPSDGHSNGQEAGRGARTGSANADRPNNKKKKNNGGSSRDGQSGGGNFRGRGGNDRPGNRSEGGYRGGNGGNRSEGGQRSEGGYRGNNNAEGVQRSEGGYRGNNNAEGGQRSEGGYRGNNRSEGGQRTEGGYRGNNRSEGGQRSEGGYRGNNRSEGGQRSEGGYRGNNRSEGGQRTENRGPREEGDRRSEGSSRNGDSRGGSSRFGDRPRSRNGNGDQGGNRRAGSSSNRSKKKLGPGLDPEQLIRRAAPVQPEAPYVAPRTFDEFPIDSLVKKALRQRGFKTPTEIQERTIDAAIAGSDLLGIANTGTGKTAAFLIPILERLIHSPQHFDSLILVPTRELALQVYDEFVALTPGMRLFAQKFIGGTSVNEDIRRMKQRPHVIIGTPGRIADLINRGALPMNKIEVLVLDEFDRMLDMGFVHEVERMAAQMTNRKQNLLFSATIDNGLKEIIGRLLEDPITVKVSSGQSSSDTIDQDIVRIGNADDKIETLVTMLQHEDFSRVIVFAETKHRVSKLCRDLKKMGVAVDEIHGDKTQRARQIALDKFKKGNIQVLCATDVAARGIDVQDISHVINYEVPRTYDSYVHRIGRTGRAGKRGKALTFVG